MSTSAISESISTAGSTSSNSSSSEELSNISIDTETFLTLLVAQLQYQDPLDPQTDTEFVTQLAQMSTLEEMQGIGSDMEGMQAYSLVGQYVYAESVDSDTGMTACYFGSVDSVVNSNGTYYATINGDKFKVNDIVQIFDSSLLDTDTTLVNSSNLIGKTVTGVYKEDDGTTAEITGVVTSVAYVDGVVCAVINGTQVAVENIISISSGEGTTDTTQTTNAADTENT